MVETTLSEAENSVGKVTQQAQIVSHYQDCYSELLKASKQTHDFPREYWIKITCWFVGQ